MTSLAQRQAELLNNLHNEDAALPEGWSSRHTAGLAIYRNNYRSALIDALLDTFARTSRWVGEESFRKAAAHHIILNPPKGWTLDDVGLGFDVVLSELFVNDPEVSELAWTEWSMSQIFGSLNADPLTGARFAAATTNFHEDDWGSLCLNFMPRTATRIVQNDIAAIWRALNEDEIEIPEYDLAVPLACHIFREGEQPVFITAPAYEAVALEAMINGANFGQVLAVLSEQMPSETAATEAGAMLGRWIKDGMVAAIR